MKSDIIDNIWIEAEEWAEGHWNNENDNTDVIVTLMNGEKYVGSFFTYTNIQELTSKNERTGENLNGKYLWSSDMILIDKCSRQNQAMANYRLPIFRQAQDHYLCFAHFM